MARTFKKQKTDKPKSKRQLLNAKADKKPKHKKKWY
jgi:hypothetical protein